MWAEEERRTVVDVAVSELRSGVSVRAGGLRPLYTRALAQVMVELSPIVVQRDSMRVVDGQHRLRAAQLNEQETIRAGFFDGTETEAYLYAVEVNTTGGLPLTSAERWAAAERIGRLRPDLPRSTIARIAALPPEPVEVPADEVKCVSCLRAV